VLRYGSTLARYLWLVVAAYALLAYQDLLLHSPFAFSLSNSPGSVYARTSVILGALALIVAFQKFPIPRRRSLELAGRYSLGFFVVHKWVWYGLTVLAARAPLSAHLFYVMPVLIAIFSIALSCLLVALLARTPAWFLVTGSSPARLRAGGAAGKAGGSAEADVPAGSRAPPSPNHQP
jgi:hypothetical protein